MFGIRGKQKKGKRRTMIRHGITGEPMLLKASTVRGMRKNPAYKNVRFRKKGRGYTVIV